MGSEYSTIKQHEPLRAPKGWGEQEKRFVAQLEEILDDLYSRFGRLKDSDLSKPLRKSIAKSEKGVSELAQTSESLTAAFRDIGTIGVPTGETRVDKNGVTVTHKNIGGYTEMNADGLRMHDETGAVVGGMYESGGEVKSAVQSLINPKYPAFEVTVAPVSYDDEQIGISFKMGGEAVCGIDAYRNGEIKNMFVTSGGDIVFQFYGKDPFTGEYGTLSVKASEIYRVIGLVLS